MCIDLTSVSLYVLMTLTGKIRLNNSYFVVMSPTGYFLYTLAVCKNIFKAYNVLERSVGASMLQSVHCMFIEMDTIKVVLFMVWTVSLSL